MTDPHGDTGIGYNATATRLMEILVADIAEHAEAFSQLSPRKTRIDRPALQLHCWTYFYFHLLHMSERFSDQQKKQVLSSVVRGGDTSMVHEAIRGYEKLCTIADRNSTDATIGKFRAGVRRIVWWPVATAFLADVLNYVDSRASYVAQYAETQK